MEAVKRQVKVNKYEIIPAWAYLLITILIFGKRFIKCRLPYNEAFI